jgi:hypothetical protein
MSATAPDMPACQREQLLRQAVIQAYAIPVGDHFVWGPQERERMRRDLARGRPHPMVKYWFRRALADHALLRDVQEHGT